MRKRTLIIIPLFFFCLLLFSCSNVQNLYDRENYKAVIETVGKMKSPGLNDLLLQTKAYVNLGEENKALESALLYLLSYDGKDEQGRAYAVNVFLDTCQSERIAVLVLNRDDGFEARKTLYKAYYKIDDYENAVLMLNDLASEMDFNLYINLLLDAPISDDRVLETFISWYEIIDEDESDIFLSLLCRFSSEVDISESVAWRFLSLTDALTSNEYITTNNIRLSTVLKTKGNILEKLYDRVNARSYWSQALNLNPDDEELRNKLK